MTIQKLNTSRSVATRSTYVGEKGRLFYDETDGILYLSDGRTPGGILISGGAGGDYTLPVATSTVLGGVKIGSNISINSGVISVAAPFSGSYTDLTNKPTIPSLTGYATLTGEETLTNKTLTSPTITDGVFQHTFSIGNQVFYEHGYNGFSVNEDFDIVGEGNFTGYHYTSGAGRDGVAFTLARTGQFTTGFGIHGTAEANEYVIGSETTNTDFVFKKSIGMPFDVSGGTDLFRISNDGSVTFSDGTKVGAIEGAGTSGVLTPTNTDFLIEANNGQQVWAFAKDGTMEFPNDTIKATSALSIATPTTSGIPASVANWNGQGGWNQGYYSDLATTGGTGTGLTVNVAANGGGYINITAITIHTPGSGYTDGDVITINNENNLPGTFTISTRVNSWAFGTDGSLQFPDATNQTTAALPYVKTAYNVVNATATMDTITVSWIFAGSGNHVEYSTLSSSDVTYAWSGMNIIAGVTTSFNSAGTYVMNAANYPDPPWFNGIFNTIGDVQIVYMQDITNSKTYRITATATSTYTGAAARGSILIERII